MRTTVRTRILALVAALALPALHVASAQECGDVNNNGSVTSSDALAVLRKAVGQATTLVCAPPSTPVTTGEATSYGTGSDGALQAGSARTFTDNGDGTITDTATGLMWEKKDNAGGVHDKDTTYTWSTGSGNMNGAVVTSFLAVLNAGSGFAGHKDWRIPNRFELETLLNVDDGSPSTPFSFNSGCPASCTVLTCSCTRAGLYWSSTTYATNTTGAWSVNFNDADVTANLKTAANYARAVRGGLL